LELAPGSPDAQSWLAGVLAARVLDQIADSAAADTQRAERLVGQALATSPRSPLAHFAKGQVLRAQGRWDEAIPEYETALAFNQNWVGALAYLGFCKFWTGAIEEAIPLYEQAIRLSPRDPGIGIWHFRIGLVHLVQSRIDEAILWLEKSRSAIPGHPNLRAALASAYGLKGETEHASNELAEVRKITGYERFSSIARLKEVGFFAQAPGYFGAPKTRALFETTYFAGLRQAGVPED
jgi:tetratricopeptide (TPR) repeat protein